MRTNGSSRGYHFENKHTLQVLNERVSHTHIQSKWFNFTIPRKFCGFPEIIMRFSIFLEFLRFWGSFTFHGIPRKFVLFHDFSVMNYSRYSLIRQYGSYRTKVHSNYREILSWNYLKLNDFFPLNIREEHQRFTVFLRSQVITTLLLPIQMNFEKLLSILFTI